MAACPVLAGTDTGITVALVRDGDRAILTAPGAIARLTTAMLPPALAASARHLHVASYHLLDGLRAGLPGLVRSARAAGATVSVDPQGDISGGGVRELRELAPDLDVLFVNEAEQRELGPVDGPLVVVKRGAEGAFARTADGDVEVRAPAVDAVDTTGAGDAFDAGFLAARAGRHGVPAALELACACGALSTRALGGVAAQPTLEEARAAIA